MADNNINQRSPIKLEGLVTVIVPVYKTEKYLKKCIDSILRQTYTELQILLIDDGSPDKCGMICDTYKEMDPRVEVIHKENGGLASVRNVGLKASRGEWLAWIDSDDWVEDDMIEYLLRGVLTYHADIAVCGRYDVFQKNKYYFGPEEIQALTPEMALRALLDPNRRDIENYVCDKLWKRSLFEGITFPEGKTFEDFAVTFRLFEKANSIICLPDAKYYYVQRSGSIMQDVSIRNTLNRYDAAKVRYDGMIDNWPQFEKMLADRCIRMAVKVWTSYKHSPKQEKLLARQQLREISRFLTPYIKAGASPDILGRADKLIVKLVPYPYDWSFALADIINFTHRVYKGYFIKDLKHSEKIVFSNLWAWQKSGKEFTKYGYVRRNSRYIDDYRNRPVKENMILYEAFWGRGMMCNLYALFLFMLNDPAYVDYEHVWVIDKLSDYAESIKKFANFRNVRFVEYMQRDYLTALSEAKFLFTNTAFPNLYIKKEGQICINTWHGIPLKKIGPDVPGGVLESGNVIRSFLLTDYLISANPFLSEIYTRTYSLQGLYNGKIIEEGYPRLDTLIRKSSSEYQEQFRQLGVSVEKNKKIILFAPTWRESYKGRVKILLQEYENVKKKIEAALPEYQVLVKVHQYVYQELKGTVYPSYIIPATIDANEVLPVADILLVDYSSMYFDYLYFERPILFYIPDITRYTDYRGLYFKIEDLPGPASENLEDVITWIKDIDNIYILYREKLAEGKKWCCEYPVGDIARHITDIIIKGKHEGYSVSSVHDHRKKILIQTGQLDNEPLIYMLMSIQNKIDFENYDLTFATPAPLDLDEKKIYEKFDHRIRVIVQNRCVNVTLQDSIKQNVADMPGGSIYDAEFYHEEVKRRYSGCIFDTAFHLGDYTTTDLMVTALLRGEDTKSADLDLVIQNRQAIEEFLSSLE